MWSESQWRAWKKTSAIARDQLPSFPDRGRENRIPATGSGPRPPGPALMPRARAPRPLFLRAGAALAERVTRGAGAVRRARFSVVAGGAGIAGGPR